MLADWLPRMMTWGTAWLPGELWVSQNEAGVQGCKEDYQSGCGVQQLPLPQHSPARGLHGTLLHLTFP